VQKNILESVVKNIVCMTESFRVSYRQKW